MSSSEEPQPPAYTAEPQAKSSKEIYDKGLNLTFESSKEICNRGVLERLGFETIKGLNSTLSPMK